MKVTVVGTGYVGLVTGACLADVGHEVLCIDLDQSKIDRLNDGEIPIHEPGLEAVVKRNRDEGRLSFSTSPAEGAHFADVVMIAVGTPPDEDGSADLSARAGGRALARPAHVALHRGGRQEHGAGGHRRQGGSGDPRGTGEARLRCRIRGCVQPRIPQGRRGGGRLPEAGPDRAGHRRRPRRADHARALCTVSAQPRTPDRDVPAFRGIDQVRRQRDAGDPHLVHERTRQPRRSARRRHRGGAPRASGRIPASAIRSSMPAPAMAARAFPRT